MSEKSTNSKCAGDDKPESLEISILDMSRMTGFLRWPLPLIGSGFGQLPTFPVLYTFSTQPDSH